MFRKEIIKTGNFTPSVQVDDKNYFTSSGGAYRIWFTTQEVEFHQMLRIRNSYGTFLSD